MTQAFSPTIDRFLGENNVMSVTAYAHGELWAANVFYCVYPDHRALLFYTSLDTTHGRLMQVNPSVAATIAPQGRDIKRLQGLQLRGPATVLAGDGAEHARMRFECAFPGISSAHTPIWALTPTYLKMVDNTRGFGYKEEWAEA